MIVDSRAFPCTAPRMYTGFNISPAPWQRNSSLSKAQSPNVFAALIGTAPEALIALVPYRVNCPSSDNVRRAIGPAGMGVRTIGSHYR